jgi:hypothetical protein
MTNVSLKGIMRCSSTFSVVTFVDLERRSFGVSITNDL